MAVTAWKLVGTVVTAGTPHPTPGVVVNGGATGTAPTPETGRGYPR